jgi:hypothetical protein
MQRWQAYGTSPWKRPESRQAEEWSAADDAHMNGQAASKAEVRLLGIVYRRGRLTICLDRC